MEFTFGIEEEFFVVHERTLLIEPQAHGALMARANELAGGGINPELLQSQVETATPVCSDFGEARAHMRRLRGGLAGAAKELGLSDVCRQRSPTGRALSRLPRALP